MGVRLLYLFATLAFPSPDGGANFFAVAGQDSNGRKCSLREHVELVDAPCVRLRRVDDVFAGEELPYGATP